MKITLLNRPGCHLCDEALMDLNSYLEESGLDAEVELLDIERDEQLHRRFMERIPVVLVEGEIVCELAFDSEEMDAATRPHLPGRG